ncbi:MAG: 4Fe-4S binding protein, partial [Prevotellaceae bacterium]|nr:4Fe-4S binding protein [Prevotellaceae bacterium]
MKTTIFILLFGLTTASAAAQNRFPKPDFESGYEYPELQYTVPNETLWTIIDVTALTAMMSIVAWAVIRKRNRKPVFWVSVASVAYFGFFRNGCVCSIGAIQNVALALADSTYAIPVAVLLFFILPVVFTFLFGRVFCAGVCPLGALQELVNIKSYRIPRALAQALGIIPWVYFAFAVLYAATRTSFIICQFDPFIGIFRLGGHLELIIIGALLLLAAIFTGRPFCRFLCPYGALLSLFSRVSIWKIKITPKCINCELCHNACPVDAIAAPYENKVKETRLQGVKRIMLYLLFLPLMVAAGAIVLRGASDTLSLAHRDVRLYKDVQHAASNAQRLDKQHREDVETFLGQGGTEEEISVRAKKIQAQFK